MIPVLGHEDLSYSFEDFGLWFIVCLCDLMLCNNSTNGVHAAGAVPPVGRRPMKESGRLN